MKRLAVIMGLTTSALTSGGAAHGQDVNAVQVVAQNAANWVNGVGWHWASNGQGSSWWKNVSPVYAPTSLPFIGQQVMYGPPSGVAPVRPTAIESLIAVNC